MIEAFSLYLLIIAQMIAVVATSIHIVLSQRDVPSAVGWMGLVWLTPLIGLVLYWIFGVNRITRKAHRLRPETARHTPLRPEQQAPHQLAGRFPELIALGRVGDQLTQTALAHGNRVQPLINGDQAYPQMLAAIGQAQCSVALSTYIFEADCIGAQFIDALAQAQQRGVAVRVLIDGVGQHYSRPSIAHRLRQRGLQVGIFLTSALPIRNQYLNLRNHRKILVVDGRIGFTGGLNIRSACMLATQPPRPVQDLHFRIEGPVVRGLMEAFALDWTFTTNEQLRGWRWFPSLTAVGDSLARCIADGPDEDFDVIRRLILGALAEARQQVRIITPYFLPDQTLITALNVTALRGIRVQILFPEHNNLRFVQWAATAEAERILNGGCQVFVSPPPFDHTKLMLIDQRWCLFGSANWDPRSLRLNFELNVECYDSAVSHRLNRLFDDKLKTAKALNAAELRGRPLVVKLRDGFARLFSPYF